MTIENSNAVDGLGISKSDGKAVLTISDHIGWTNEAVHFDLLEKKIGAYLSFIHSGQLFEMLPNSRGRDVRIEVVLQHQPTEAASKFFNAARQQLHAMGFELTYGGLPENY